MPYGLAIGVIAAQCLSEPMTQYMIDSKLRSGGGGGGSNPVDRMREILAAKTTEGMKETQMTIMLKDPYGKIKVKCKKLQIILR